ncbi:MAG TPA: anhydro-N-acetylmuramic acid kinase [Candidatus Acidoferrum sp.]|nr:anhydro-N-acetylmuramic acid kinase [Candidatus Acidoferrum sp.]
MNHSRSEKPLRVLGIMSGTSADGIDVALARISGAPPKLSAHLENHAVFPFPPKVHEGILRIAGGTHTTTEELSQLNFLIGELFADAAIKACSKFRVPLARISLIGSHGQTIYHQGKPSRAFGTARIASTSQIGEPAVIAARTGITTVADFRPADMAVGGQGAPLVPFVDYLLYRHPRIGRVALNIGGIANVTVIPVAAKPRDVFAFDTGPGNMVIDALVRHFTDGREKFDRNAKIAASGEAIPALLEIILRKDPYFTQRPPKSAGREQFGESYAQRFIKWGKQHHERPEDLICTATALTSFSIIDAWHRFIAPRARINQLILAGGGAHNPLIMAQLSAGLSGVEVIPAGALGVPEDAKEAFAFAILAYETFHRRAANLPAATGARRPAILGKICYAPPK